MVADKGTGGGPDFDVAISFLQADEARARRLKEGLEEQGWRVFLYTDRQAEIAGRDGVDRFRSIFREDSKLSVVLFRQGWGDTNWTALEAQAIKDKQLNDHWRSLVVAKLDEAPLPDWVPESHIWVDLERFGVDQLVAVIDTRLRELGSERRTDTVSGIAARLRAKVEREARRQRLLHSEAGVAASEEALDQLYEHLEDQVRQIREVGTDLAIARKEYERHVFVVRGPRASFTMGWSRPYGNSLEYSSLLINEYDAPYHFGGLHGGPQQVNQVRASFTVDPDGNPAWIEDAEPEKYFSSRQLGDRYLERLLERNSRPSENSTAW